MLQYNDVVTSSGSVGSVQEFISRYVKLRQNANFQDLHCGAPELLPTPPSRLIVLKNEPLNFEFFYYYHFSFLCRFDPQDENNKTTSKRRSSDTAK